MRPKMSVSKMRATTTNRFNARMAGRSCTFAIHPNQWWSVPVKSRKSNVIPMKNTVAKMILIFLKFISVIV